jgi:DNA-directed RNA polymerase specialized sigma24 family protein
LRARGGHLARFARAEAVVEYLAHAGGNLDEKDLVLSELVLASRPPAAASLASSLLLLGLWPGLDAAFWRRAPYWRDRTAELGAELIGTFSNQVRRFDPTRVHRVASTLVRSTEREVVRGRLRELRRQRRVAQSRLEVAGALATSDSQVDEVPSPARVAEALCPHIPGARGAETIEALRVWLGGLVGGDADLVIDGVVLERSRLELAAERGIKEHAARKRLQRALLRIRKRLQEQIQVSRDGGEMAFGAHEHELRAAVMCGLGRVSAPARPV